MDQYLNNRQNEILWNLLANPADNGHLYAYNLQQLVNDFPQSGLLHAMLLHADGKQSTSHASAYLNPRAIYALINAPESLAELSDSRIIQQLGDKINYAGIEGADQLQLEDEGLRTNDLSDTDAEEQPLSAEHTIVVEETESVVAGVEENIETVEAIEPLGDEDKIIATSSDEKNEPESFAENIREDELVTETTSFELAEPPRGIDDDVYDEIVGIEDISFAQAVKPADELTHLNESSAVEEELIETATNVAAAEPIVQRERVLNMDDEAEKLIVGNIAATDYFVFDKAFNDRRQVEPPGNDAVVLSSELENDFADVELTAASETTEVSKYHDDTMPYTFMWWLNKTRIEHAGIYQPFKLDTTQAIRHTGAEELQQQYYENIFHLNSVEELDRSTPQHPIEFDPKSKEDRIIKRFIVEEPHITTPSADKLDTENKARKSAEDQDELVTETLARIYTEQMLYHKAINTYKKLMLKFPEKSRYFADQIEQLERKTN